MSSNDKNLTNDTQKQDHTPAEPLTEKEVASKKPAILLAILILLIVSIVGVFGYMVNVAMKEDAIDQSVAAVKMKENEARLTVDTEGEALVPSVELTEKCSFYSKLASSQPVSVLVIGDVFGTGAGAEGGSDWIALFKEGLKESFGSDVTVNNLSLANRNDAYAAYVSLMNEVTGNKETVYDAVIISLGYYDDPFNFKLQYEGILRAVKKNYSSSEIIGIIESSAVTDTEGYSDETALYARELLSYYGGIDANMGEAFAVTGKDYSELTVDGVLPNAEGQKLYADWILKKINEKLYGADDSGAAQFRTESPEAVNPDSKLYDEYHYIPADSFLRADDLNFIIGIKDLEALTVENVGMLGIDYEYVEGKNTVQIVLDRKIFAGLQNEYEGTEPERHIRIVNNNATVYEEMAVSFATKEQADAFHGIIMTGNLNLHQGEEKYDKLPMPPETTAPPETEPATEENDNSEKKETTAADSKKKKSDDSDDETKKESENRRRSGSSNRTNTPQPQPAPVPETAAPETAAPTPETVAETAPTVPSQIEGPVISDPANSGNIETAATYSVEAGQGIDVEQWNSVGPTVG